MDISVAIASAWSLLKDISLGVGANELHRQLVERFQRSGAANLDLQKALYASLLDAVDSLGKTLSSENHPYFLAISDLHERHDEQKRVQEIFKEIRAHLPKTSALQSPATLIFDDSSPTHVKTLLGRVGLESYLESLPESLRSAFESNLPFVMLAHFRRQVATDDRLHALLQHDLTTAGFQAVHRELRAISDFLRQQCGSDDPAKIQVWTENLASDLKNFMAGQFEEVKSELAEIKKEIKERWDDDDLFRLMEASSPDKTITRYLEKKAAGQIYVADKLAEDFTEKLERNGSLLIHGLPGSGKTITGLALAESFHDGRCRLFYVSLRHDINEDTLVKGIRRRLSRPTIFLLDDCHDKFEMLDLVQNRFSAEMRGKGFLVFMARTTPTPEDMPGEIIRILRRAWKKLKRFWNSSPRSLYSVKLSPGSNPISPDFQKKDCVKFSSLPDMISCFSTSFSPRLTPPIKLTNSNRKNSLRKLWFVTLARRQCTAPSL